MIIRCSSLDRFLSCPGSSRLIEAVRPTLPKEKDTAVSMRGTNIHAAAHTALVNDHGATPPVEPLTRFRISSLNPYDRWHAHTYLEHVIGHSPNMALLVEQHLEMPLPEGNTLSGHIDCYAITPDGRRAHLHDLKTGYDPVDPAEVNWQITGYIALLKYDYPDLEDITADIVQPAMEGEERITRIHLQGQEIDTVIEYLVKKITGAIRSNTLNSDILKPCRYCPAAPRCPAFRGELENAMKTALTVADIERAARPDLATLVYLRECATRMTDPLDRAKEELVSVVEGMGGSAPIPDGRIVSVATVNGRRSFTDADEAKARLETLSLSEAEKTKSTEISISALEAVLAEKHGVPVTSKSGKPCARNILEAHFSGILIQSTQTRISIK